MTPDQARAIVQDGLDAHGKATLAGDIDAMLAFCDTPCAMETLSGRAVATTVPEMRAICEKFVHSVQMMRVSRFVRRCLDANFKAPDEIWATYETRFLRDGVELAGETYMSMIILNKHSDGWKFRSIQLLVTEDGPVSATLDS